MYKRLVTLKKTFNTQILTFCLLTEPFRRKNRSSEKKIFERNSEYPSGWFWKCKAKLNRLILSLFWRPWKFYSLYGYLNKHFRKLRCNVAVEIRKLEAASLILSWGNSRNIYRTFSTLWSLVRGLPLPPLWEIFALSINWVCHCMTVLRAGGSFLILVRTQRCVLLIDWFQIYSATIRALSWGLKLILVPDFDFEVCLLFLLLQLNTEHICKVENFSNNPSKNQQQCQSICTMSIKSKERANTSNQIKQKINFPLNKMWPTKPLSMKISGFNLIVFLYHIVLNFCTRSR